MMCVVKKKMSKIYILYTLKKKMTCFGCFRRQEKRAMAMKQV